MSPNLWLSFTSGSTVQFVPVQVLGFRFGNLVGDLWRRCPEGPTTGPNDLSLRFRFNSVQVRCDFRSDIDVCAFLSLFSFLKSLLHFFVISKYNLCFRLYEKGSLCGYDLVSSDVSLSVCWFVQDETPTFSGPPGWQAVHGQ